MILAAAEWFEILAALIFLLVTAAAQFIQKRVRNQREVPTPEDDDSDTSAHPPGRHPPPLVEADEPMARDHWEQQLRRLIQGETTSTAPPVIAPSPPPPPQTPHLPRPAQTHRGRPVEERPVRAERAPSTIEQAHRAAASKLAAAAADPYRRIASFRERTPRVTLARAAPARISEPSSRSDTRRASAVIGMFRHPRSARQAIIAATVLHPPKGLE
jgi:hypothetical protein